MPPGGPGVVLVWLIDRGSKAASVGAVGRGYCATVPGHTACRRPGGCVPAVAGTGRGPQRFSKSATVQHVVQRGDTCTPSLSAMALDYRKVAEVNSIGPPYTIYQGRPCTVAGDCPPAYVAPPQATPPPALPVRRPRQFPMVATPVPTAPAPAGSPVVVNAVPELAIPKAIAPAPAAVSSLRDRWLTAVATVPA